MTADRDSDFAPLNCYIIECKAYFSSRTRFCSVDEGKTVSLSQSGFRDSASFLPRVISNPQNPRDKGLISTSVHRSQSPVLSHTLPFLIALMFFDLLSVFFVPMHAHISPTSPKG